MKMSPLAIEIILYYHTSPPDVDYYNLDSPVSQDIIENLTTRSCGTYFLSPEKGG
tara:strand:+ start:236 stop:400 length:165 start_codon:yes stop_codon:yes gene_type:complete